MITVKHCDYVKGDTQCHEPPGNDHVSLEINVTKLYIGFKTIVQLECFDTQCITIALKTHINTIPALYQTQLEHLVAEHPDNFLRNR